jgi:pimeloyl-[acyl-carrier protein] methyl ester esterase
LNAASLHCEAAGRGSPVVLLHGWGLNLRVFDDLARELSRNHRVLRLDLPGHGHSAFDETNAGFDAQLDAILTHVPEHSAVIGWSLGGQFALEVARRVNLRGFALLSSTPRFVNGDDWVSGMKPLFLRAFAARLIEDWRGVLDEFLALQVRGARGATDALAEMKAALEGHGMPDPRALAQGLALLRDNDLRPHAPLIATPALLISGQHDRVTPPSASAWLAQALPNARHVELARAGHAPFLSHAGETARLLQEFLTGLPA